MLRLVLRFDRTGLARWSPRCRFGGVAGLERAHRPRGGSDGVAGILEVRLSPGVADATRRVGHGGFRRLEPLGTYGDRHFRFGETSGPPEIMRALPRRSLFVDVPIRRDDRYLTLGFPGSGRSLRSSAARLGAGRIPHEVVALGDARVDLDFPSGALTRAPRSAVRAAAAGGSLAFPRRTGLAERARVAGISKSAFSRRPRAAERRLVERTVGA